MDTKTVSVKTTTAISMAIILFFISHNNALAQAQNTPTLNNQNPNYNIKPGSWVRYTINGPSVQSDNKLLGLAMKGIVSNAFPFGNTTSLSFNDIEWIQRNITGISRDNVTIQNVIKPYGKEPIIFKPVSWSLSDSTFHILRKNVKIGEGSPSNSNSAFSPSLIVSRTVQKNIGGHNVAVYEVTGQRNSFNSTSKLATQFTITSYDDKVTGIPLQASFSFELGAPLFGTVSASLGFSAIDWSGRVGK